MSYTRMHAHDIVGIVVSEVKQTTNIVESGLTLGLMDTKLSRWQDITFKFADGGEHTITAFLAVGYPGFEYMQREPMLERRVDDIPGQLALPLE